MKNIAMMLSLSASCAVAQPDTIVGYAYDVKQADLSYMETYSQVYDANGLLLKSKVQYISPENNVLAEKQLDYSNHPYAPNFTFKNHVGDYVETVQWLDGDKVLIKRKDPGKQWNEKVINIPEPAVADAGFDAFLKDQHLTLKQGNTVYFNFLNPARLDWFRFTATAIDRNDTTITVKVAPASTLLRWLVDPILLTYQLPNDKQQTPRLLHYSGLTNMSINGKDSLVANIFYEYDEHQSKHQPKQIVNLF